MYQKKILIFFFCASHFFLPSIYAQNEKPLKSLYDYDSKLFLFDPQGFNPFQYRPFESSSYTFVKGTGQTDAIGGIYFDNYKNQYLVLSENFLQLNTNLFVSEKIFAKTIMDLQNYPIGVVKGDFVIDFFNRHYPFLKLAIFDSFEELIFDTLRGQIMVFAQNFPTAMLYLSKYQALNHFKQFRIFFPETQTQESENLKKLLDIPLRKKENGEKEKKEEKKPAVNKPPVKKEKSTLKESQKQQEHPKKTQLPPKNFFFFLKQIGFGITFLTLFILIGLFFFLWYKKRTSKLQNPHELLLKGENQQVEFKSSLRFDYQTGQINPALEYAVMKSLAAFLNSKGGSLFVGVNDLGKIIGLEADYKILAKKNKDGWVLKFSELVNDYLGKENHQYLKVSILHNDNEKEWAWISVLPSKKPVFLKHKNKEEFYIRTGVASQAMNIKETHEYITSHWK